ncbi:hypothetical protein DNU06_03970 [Putridiphycobacter roseus]|uniref:Response regulatory domain-containing protein n=1 Tax=Putridiphycobacter roseus TaxID=2219161 RepID=A0A2W1N1V7_9FLAO|nr:response regulator [Putridiphycobacter roseus]PZE17784.1 hypothetical protein DNU06_03970 [Putridiphycobacter roseus]
MSNKEIKKIIIVDDEVDICYLIKSILKRKFAAKIDICNSVEEALDKLKVAQYDLAFFDMRLNDGTGEELISQVHEEGEPKPYIAVISAYTSPSDMSHLNDLKIDEFIPKPLSSEKIINCYLAATA